MRNPPQDIQTTVARFFENESRHALAALTLAALLALTQLLPGWGTLFLGIVISIAFNTALPVRLKPWSSRLLGVSIVFLSGQASLDIVLKSAQEGLLHSALLIVLVLGLSQIVAPFFKIDSAITTLIGSGTAICGGSAIAATAPAIGARPDQVGISIAVVFLLNAVAILLFPFLGQRLGLDPQSFGEFAALGIHDTSSVVAASVQFGQGAEHYAVPMKLARALWIIPVAAFWGWRTQTQTATHPLRAPWRLVPWFIPAYILGAGFFSMNPEWASIGEMFAKIGKALLLGTLFLIGHSVTKESLRKAGLKALLFGCILWAFTLLVSIAMIWS